MIWSVALPLAGSAGLTGLLGATALKSPRPIEWRELLVPDDLKAEQVTALMRHIAAVREGPIRITVVAAQQRVHFYLGAPMGALKSVVAAGMGVVPAGRFENTKAPTSSGKRGSTVAARIGWNGRWPMLRANDPESTIAALLGVMASAGKGERLELHLRLWPAGRVERPLAQSERPQASPVPWPFRIFGSSQPPGDEVRAIRGKYSGLLVRAEIVAISAAPKRASAIANMERVIAALRMAGGSRGILKYRSVHDLARVRRLLDRRRSPLPWENFTLLSPEELVSLSGFPIDTPAIAGVSYGVGPRLMPPIDLPKRGRVFAKSNFPSTEGQPLAQPVVGGLQHVLAVGPTGSGKSTLIGSLIRDDLNSGRGMFVLDLKGDLVEEVLAHIPERRVKDVVVLEPHAGGAQPGLRLFSRDGDPELTSDLILGTLAEMFADSWGIRSSQYLGIGLRTLAAVPGSTLVDLPALFTDDRFRNKVLRGVTDPWLRAAWKRFLSLSAAERATHVSSPLTKLEELVGRGRLRLVLGQSKSKLDFHEALSHGRIILVSLPPGLLGTPATRLLAALTLWQFFQAVEGRIAIPQEQRAPFFAYIDEVAVLRALPVPIDSMLERARGHGCGLTVSPQSLSQLTPDLRASLLANVGSVVTFQQPGEDEARAIARVLPGVTPSQLQHLGRYEVAMRLSLGPGAITPTMTGTTSPPPDPISKPDEIRRASSSRWGLTLEEIDAELARRHGLVDAADPESDRDESGGFGVRRRTS